MADGDFTINSSKSALANKTISNQQEILFEQIAHIAEHLDRTLTHIMGVDESEIIETQRLAHTSKLLINQIGWMADLGIGAANGTGMPTVKGNAEKWLLPWSYNRPKEEACT